MDDLCQQVLAGEGQPTEALHHIKCKLQRLSIALYPSAQPEPLDDIQKQYTDTLCSAQKQTNLANNFTQLEDWLGDIETAADRSAESRTKLAQTKSKGLTPTLYYRRSYLR